jgi:hypothetical protein
MSTPDAPAPVATPSLRTILPSIVIDGLLPFLTYKLLTAYVPGMSDVRALAIGAVFPAVRGVVELLHRRSVDVIGAIVLAGIVVSIVGITVGGSPRLLLIRESFVTAALALVALSSLAWKRPLLFYVGRQFAAGEDPEAKRRFDALWDIEGARRVFRLLTLVWSAGWLVEFALRVAMVLTLSVSTVLAVSPILFNGITLGLIAWTLAYVRRKQRSETVESRPDAFVSIVQPFSAVMFVLRGGRLKRITVITVPGCVVSRRGQRSRER